MSMDAELISDFLADFDDSRFPEDFLEVYEPMECFASNELGETLLVKQRETGEFHIAKCYSENMLQSRVTESDLLRSISHKGLPKFISEHQNEKMLCVVRSFVRGIPLDEYVREKTITGADIVSIAVQLCDILMYLHGQTPPIIHRDIKPQNIIVDENGDISLIDFGISREYKEDSRSDTLCLGTKFYAAPEQYGFSQTDCRTDIYSLGVLLCWLATGNTEIEQGQKAIRNKWLANIINKCTAFAPKDRFKSAAQVKDALTGRSMRRRILMLACAVVFVLAGIFLLANFAGNRVFQPAGISFKEPLIEEAVRMTLGKGRTDMLTEQDLLLINELYIFGDQVATDAISFNNLTQSFVENDGTIQRGNISELDDLVQMKNLRSITLAYQNISDLSVLSDLYSLENIDLRHNPIEDISPLSSLPSLSSLCVFDTRISDLTALSACPRLKVVDVGNTLIESTTAFDGLDVLQILVMRKAPLSSLENIETHPLLEKIYLSETLVNDLSPLLDLPRLQTVEISENMRFALDGIENQAQFEIVFP